MRRVVRDLRERFARPGRIVYGQLLRGACYGIGTGAIGLAFLWLERLL
jgi:hypothetical protein